MPLALPAKISFFPYAFKYFLHVIIRSDFDSFAIILKK
jgi:hypothetical protein